MARLANMAFFLHEELTFIFGIGPTGADIIKLKWPRDHVVAAVTHGRGPKSRIILRGMRRDRIIEGSKNHPIAYMTSCTAHTFLLIGVIIPRVFDLNSLLHTIIRNALNERGLLIL